MFNLIGWIIIIYITGWFAAYALIARAASKANQEWSNDARVMCAICSLLSWLSAIIATIVLLCMIIKSPSFRNFLENFAVPILRKIEGKKVIQYDSDVPKTPTPIKNLNDEFSKPL